MQLVWPLFSLQDHKHIFTIRSHAAVSYYMQRFWVLSQLMPPFLRGSYRSSPVCLRQWSAASQLTVWGFYFSSWFVSPSSLHLLLKILKARYSVLFAHYFWCVLCRDAPSYLSNTHTSREAQGGCYLRHTSLVISEVHLSCFPAYAFEREHTHDGCGDTMSVG